MRHYMLDIETVGNTPDSAILAVGIMAFDPTDNWEKHYGRDFDVIGECIIRPDTDIPLGVDISPSSECFFGPVNLSEQCKKGLRMTGDTMKWWMDSPEKIKSFKEFTDDAWDVPRFFQELKFDILFSDCPVWTCGQFDLPIFHNFCLTFGEEFPFKRFWQFMEMKSFTIAAPEVGPSYHHIIRPEDVPAHHPLVDCYYQILAVQKATRELNAGGIFV